MCPCLIQAERIDNDEMQNAGLSLKVGWVDFTSSVQCGCGMLPLSLLRERLVDLFSKPRSTFDRALRFAFSYFRRSLK